MTSWSKNIEEKQTAKNDRTINQSCLRSLQEQGNVGGSQTASNILFQFYIFEIDFPG